MASKFPPCPPSLAQIRHFLNIAVQHDQRDPVVSYWCRLYAMESGLKLDQSTPEAKKLLFSLIDWLEKQKHVLKDNEAITNNVVAHAHMENYALKLFTWADSQERAGVFDKNVVSAYYTCGFLFKVLETFGELSEEIDHNMKYAKWRATYIHNCLQNGETPVLASAQNEPLPTDQDKKVPQSKPEEKPGNAPQTKAQNVPSTPAVSQPGTSQPGTSQPVPTSTTQSNIDIKLTPELVARAQKCCKYASSALDFDDVENAVYHLQKALKICQTGSDK